MAATQITDVLTSKVKQIVTLPEAKPNHVAMLEELQLSEVIDDLRDLEISITDDETLFTIEAKWRFSKDGGWVTALWKRSNFESHVVVVEISYQFSEDECFAKFGPGDYSSSNYGEVVLSQLWLITDNYLFPKVVDEVEKYHNQWVSK